MDGKNMVMICNRDVFEPNRFEQAGGRGGVL